MHCLYIVEPLKWSRLARKQLVIYWSCFQLWKEIWLHWQIYLICLDDILIFVRSFEKHLYHLDKMFSLFRESKLQLYFQEVLHLFVGIQSSFSERLFICGYLAQLNSRKTKYEINLLHYVLWPQAVTQSPVSQVTKQWYSLSWKLRGKSVGQ